MTKTYRTLRVHSVIGLMFLLSIGASAGTIAVPAGGDFQAALDSSQPGDVIALEAGATFAGLFTLPVKPGADWITIRTSAPDSALPAPGNRIDPSVGDALPKLVGSRGVIEAAPGAHHFRFVGVEFKPAPGTFLYNVVVLGDGSESSTGMPSHDIAFERCYLHGDPSVGSRRGIAMNAQNVTVADSYLSDFKETGGDSEAIACWNGTGPFRIVNNHLEASGVNVLFGGADAAIPNLVPSDILIANNHFVKPLAWKVDHPGYQGTHWRVKNLLELKNAQRVTIEHNFFEQNWRDGQNGFAILFTVRNQDGSSPWSV